MIYHPCLNQLSQRLNNVYFNFRQILGSFRSLGDQVGQIFLETESSYGNSFNFPESTAATPQ